MPRLILDGDPAGQRLLRRRRDRRRCAAHEKSGAMTAPSRWPRRLPAGARARSRARRRPQPLRECCWRDATRRAAGPLGVSNWSGTRAGSPRRSSRPADRRSCSAACPGVTLARRKGSQLRRAQVCRVGRVDDASTTAWRRSRASQFVAVAADLAAVRRRSASAGVRRLAASRPMRVSVQLRFADGARWVKSVYLDQDVAAGRRSGRQTWPPRSARGLRSRSRHRIVRARSSWIS